MSPREMAWAVLAAAAEGYARDKSKANSQALADAAMGWGAARNTGPSQQTREAAGMTLPFGREKGVSIGQAGTENLRWMANAIAESLDDPDKQRFRAKNEDLLAAIQRELATR